MNPHATKQLEDYILKSTSESLTQPDSQIFVEICNLINSRSDMPKIAIQAIRKRLFSKNPKVLYLTLELLEVASNACEMPFFNQMNSQDFMQTMNTLASKPLDKVVYDKLVHVVKYWTQVFAPYKDILPVLFKFYSHLEGKGIVFPSSVDSKYSYLQKTKPSQQVSHSKPYEAPESHGSYGESSSKSYSHHSQSQSHSRSHQPSGGNAEKMSSAKSSKVKKDFQIVRENLDLTNEIMDASDPREDVRKNDTLTDLVKTMKSMETKLQQFIGNMGPEEDLMAFCLELNDDLHQTFERYKALRAGRKPAPFRKKGGQAQEAQGEGGSYVKAGFAPTFDDFGKGGAKSKQEDFSAFSKVEGTGSKKGASKEQVMDLFNFDDDDASTQQKQQQPATQSQQGKSGGTDLFDLDEPAAPQPSFNQQQPQQQQQGANQVIGSLADKISSLYIQPPTGQVQGGQVQGGQVQGGQVQGQGQGQNTTQQQPNSRLMALDMAFNPTMGMMQPGMGMGMGMGQGIGMYPQIAGPGLSQGQGFPQGQGMNPNQGFAGQGNFATHNPMAGGFGQNPYGQQQQPTGGFNNPNPFVTQPIQHHQPQPQQIVPFNNQMPLGGPNVQTGYGGGLPSEKAPFDDLDDMFGMNNKQQGGQQQQQQQQQGGFGNQGGFGQQQQQQPPQQQYNQSSNQQTTDLFDF